MGIGTVVRPHGIRGALKVMPFGTVDDIRFAADVKRLVLKNTSGERAFDLVSVRYLPNALIVELAGVADSDAAQALVGMTVSVLKEDYPPLAAGRYFVEDLIGMRVIGSNGIEYGVVDGVYQTKANDVLSVATAKGTTVHMPFVTALGVTVDAVSRTISAGSVEGLFQ